MDIDDFISESISLCEEKEEETEDQVLKDAEARFTSLSDLNKSIYYYIEECGFTVWS